MNVISHDLDWYANKTTLDSSFRAAFIFKKWVYAHIVSHGKVCVTRSLQLISGSTVY